SFFSVLTAKTFVISAISSFFLIIRPPPISTLFPYTTLFRSRLARASRPDDTDSRLSSDLHRWHENELAHAPPPPSSGPPDVRSLDRKSTRLNSSHVKISYAVFCLKKKKK